MRRTQVHFFEKSPLSTKNGSGASLAEYCAGGRQRVARRTWCLQENFREDLQAHMRLEGRSIPALPALVIRAKEGVLDERTLELKALHPLSNNTLEDGWIGSDSLRKYWGRTINDRGVAAAANNW